MNFVFSMPRGNLYIIMHRSNVARSLHVCITVYCSWKSVKTLTRLSEYQPVLNCLCTCPMPYELIAYFHVVRSTNVLTHFQITTFIKYIGLTVILLLLLCSHSPNDVPPEPQRNVSIAAVRGAVRPSITVILYAACNIYILMIIY